MRLFRRASTEPNPKNTKSARRRDEASNSFALFIVMAPVIFGAFGMGLDISRNVYIRTTLQNGLDMATVSGAGVTTVNPNSNVAIVDGEAIDAIEKVYAINRRQAPTLSCWGNKARITGTNYSKCWKQYGTTRINNDYLVYGVRERSTNAFLPIIGLKYQEYNVVSRALINQDTQ